MMNPTHVPSTLNSVLIVIITGVALGAGLIGLLYGAARLVSSLQG